MLSLLLHTARSRASVANPCADVRWCSTQACSFRDSYEDFCKLGATVVGISKGDAASHQNFRKKHNLPFMLLCDEEDKARVDDVLRSPLCPAHCRAYPASFLSLDGIPGPLNTQQLQ